MNIDLGQSSESHPEDPIKPGPKKYYPSFIYSGPEEIDLPTEGEMTIEFRKAASSKTEREGGETHHTCTIEVLKITGVEGEDPKPPASNKGKESGSALDALMAEHMKKKY